MSPSSSVSSGIPATVAQQEQLVDKARDPHASDSDIVQAALALQWLKQDKAFVGRYGSFDQYGWKRFGFKQSKRAQLLRIAKGLVPAQVHDTRLGPGRLDLIAGASKRLQPTLLLYSEGVPEKLIKKELEQARQKDPDRQAQMVREALCRASGREPPFVPAESDPALLEAVVADTGSLIEKVTAFNLHQRSVPQGQMGPAAGVAWSPELCRLVDQNTAILVEQVDDLRRHVGLRPLLEHRHTPRHKDPAPAPISPAQVPAAPEARGAEAPAAPTGKVAAIRPPLYHQHHVALPVPFPSFQDEPTLADRVMGALIVAFAEFGRLSEEALRLVKDGGEVRPLLQLHCVREFHRCRTERLEIVPLVQEFADDGLKTLEQWLEEEREHDPALQIEDLFPQCTSPAVAATLTPMGWVVYDASPPFLLPDANYLEKLLLRMLGLTRYLCETFPTWHALHEKDEPHTYILAYQFWQAVKRYGAHTNQFLERFHKGYQIGLEQEARLGQEEAQRAAQRDYARRFIVTVGDPALPERFVIVGRLADGRHVAVSTSRPHLVLLIGNGGMGKTHLPSSIVQQTPHGLLPSLTPCSCPAYLRVAPR